MQVVVATIGIALATGCACAALVWLALALARVRGPGLAGALVVGIAGGAVIGALAWMVRADVGLARYDLPAARWAARNASAASTDFLRVVTLVGGTWSLIAIALVVLLVVGRRLPVWTVMLFLVVVMAGESLMVSGIKSIVDRGRPDIDRLTGFSGSSFPSGHAAASAATLAAVALLLGSGRSRRVRIPLAGIAGGLAAAIAASRVFLGVHWLTDVVAGLVFGWTWFAIVSIVFGGRLLRPREPVVAAESVERDAGPTGLGTVT